MKPHCLADVGGLTLKINKTSSTIAMIWCLVSLLTIGSTEIGMEAGHWFP